MEEKTPIENARTGYQVAVTLWTYEGNLIWSKFTAMVYANTIVLATIGLLITSKPEFQFLRIALAVLGLQLCLAWFWIIKRSFDYHNYWVFSAHELEALYIQPVETVARGVKLARGERVTFKTPDGFTYQRGRVGPKIEYVSYSVIAVFVVVYIITLFQ